MIHPNIFLIIALTSAVCVQADAQSLLTQPSTRSLSNQSYTAFTEPFQIIQTAAAESGRITTVHVQRGDHVEKGQLLVELDVSVLTASRRIAQQRADSTAKVDAAQAAVEKSKRRLEALRSLSKQGAGTNDELLDAEADALIAQSNVLAAQEELERAGLEVEEIDARLERRRIRSEISGVVTEVLHQPGEFVSAQEPEVVTVVDLSRLRATFFLPTQQASNFAVAQSVQIRIPSTEQTASGEIEHISSVTQADSGRVRLDVVVDNSTKTYRAGIRSELLPDKIVFRSTQ